MNSCVQSIDLLRRNIVVNDDCFKVLKEIPDNFFDHCFTSPPYNRKRNDKYNFHTDIMDDYGDFLSRLVEESFRVCSGFVFLNVQKNYYNKAEVFKFIGDYADNISELIVWSKTNPMPAAGSAITNAYEFFIVLSKDNKTLKSNKTYTLNHFKTPVYSSNEFSKEHRAVMHPGACAYMLNNFTTPGDFIVDPMCGVGTTLKTCAEMGSHYYGIELNREYFDICKNRGL